MTRRLLSACAIAAAFAHTASAQTKPTLTPKDYAKWESLSQPRLSPDGNWVAYGIARVSEENDLRIRGGPRDTTVVIPFCSAAQFSANSKWVACLIGVSPRERERLTKDKKPIRNAFVARNLTTGDTINVADIASFSFSPDARSVLMSKYPAEGKRVQDVFVQDLTQGTRLVFNNVAENSWADAGSLLAFTTTVDGGAGNGVQLYDAHSGVVRVLESSPSVYRALSWRPKSTDIAVLRTRVDKEYSDTAHAIVVFIGVGDESAAPKTLDATSAAIPKGLRIADYRRPSWSKDGRTLYIGLRPRDAVADAPKKGEEKVSDVEVWHPKDVRVIPDQRSGEQRDMRSTLLAAWRIGDAKVVQIGTDLQENAAVLEGDRFVTETDTKPYPFGRMFGRRDSDIWLTDINTGSHTKMLEKVRFFLGADPTGKRVAWFDGKDYWTQDVASGTRTNLTAKLTAGGKTDFVDRDDDHPNNVLPPVGGANWSKDGSVMLVNTAYDVWALSPDGSGGKRLTNGAAEGTVHRVVTTAGFGATASERAVDLSRPVYLSLYGKRTKNSGYAQLSPNGTVTKLLYADASITGFARADSAAKYLYSRQRFDESANVFLAGADLANAKPLSSTNAFQKDYAWGKAELMDFTSSIGKPLQAILYYPANYDASKKYPMIVYTYELLTQGLHRYNTPRETDYYNTTVFQQNGYFVLMPDIVFRPREPGLAVLQSVEPAVRAVIAKGFIDPARVGHVGHSQGGYEAAFLATHSKLFATTIMGSGISDMISFAGQMHWSSVPEFDHWETGQFRMEVPPWEDMAAMVKNSPLDKIHEMSAKSVLVEIGAEDPTVDMRQGVEFYNYARRAGKNVVMLLYPGEGHSLGKKENQLDYERRILQWFGHFLKDEPAPKWITEGQTWLDRKKVLDVNK